MDDQREASRRTDVAVFVSDQLKEPVKISGQPVVNLKASTSGTDSDWVVKVIGHCSATSCSTNSTGSWSAGAIASFDMRTTVISTFGSERAGQRVMESITQFITQKLKLKVNEAKSAVAQPQDRKFLGFSFTAGPEVKRVIAPKAVDGLLA